MNSPASASAAPRLHALKDATYKPPAVAFPTVAMFFSAVVLWGSSLWAVFDGLIPPIVAILVQTIASCMAYMVVHDGVHRSVLRNYPRLNDALVSFAGLGVGFHCSCAGFRIVHFKHHRYTNEPGKDPDLWCCTGPQWLLPLRWVVVDWAEAEALLKDWFKLSVKDRLQIIAYSTFTITLFSACWFLGYGMEAVLYWLLPTRLALLWLVFSFDYLPHYPCDVLQSDDPYRATRARVGGEPLMKWLFFQHNYHVVHHLFPSVPFYRLHEIWEKRKAELISLGVPVVPWSRLR